MGNLLGGGGGGSGGGGGFLGNLLGGLPDPLGVGKMLGITGGAGDAAQAMAGPAQQPMPSGMQFMQPGQPQSGVSGVPQGFQQSPISKVGFGIGGGGGGR